MKYQKGTYQANRKTGKHLTQRVAIYPIESNGFSLLTNVRNTNPCCSLTIFRINREREERAVGPSLFSSPFEW